MPEVGIHLIPSYILDWDQVILKKLSFFLSFFFNSFRFFLARLGRIAESFPFMTPDRAKPIPLKKQIYSTSQRRERDSNPR